MGIGTASPSGELHVNSTGSTDIYIDAPLANYAALQIASAGTSEWALYRPGGSTDLRIIEQGAGDRVTFASGGNVGIGTTAPGKHLTISASENNIVIGAATTSALQIINEYTAAYNRLSEINFAVGNGAANERLAGISAEYTNYDVTNGVGGKLHLWTKQSTQANPASRLTIDHTGNVGIGTTAPTVKLEVSGTGGETVDFKTSGRGQFANGTWFNSSQTIFVGPNGTNTLGFYTSPGGWAMNINNGNVGIGTTGPGYKLDVAGIAAVDYLRIDPQDGTNEGGELQLIGAGAFGTLQIDNYQGNARIHTLAAGKQFQVLGGGALIEGNVGIGADPGTYKLYVAGNAYATGTWSSSDIRWKKNIHPIHDALPNVLSLQGVTYEWRTENYPNMGFTEDVQIGLIAQDVEKVIPELVNTDDKGYKSVSYEKLGAVLLEGIKELHNKVSPLLNSIVIDPHGHINLKGLVKIEGGTVIDKSGNIMAKDLTVKGDMKVREQFSIIRSDNLARLVSINSEKKPDSEVQGYISARDVYLADAGKWATEFANYKIPTLNSLPEKSECQDESHAGMMRFVTTTKELYICTGEKGWTSMAVPNGQQVL